MSTIHMLRNGRLNPHPVLAKEIAKTLGMSEADINAIAGLDGSSRHGKPPTGNTDLPHDQWDSST
ncbi:hypothetical protein AB0J35_58855 [Nonomuraea angiospora]|uniref:hypothetical protein n=1 Tax=Nonomuraea angiospora TaxID=46172 RepID=UPI00342E05EE